MILIWEFRVLGILIRGGDDTHEREIKKKLFLIDLKEGFLVF